MTDIEQLKLQLELVWTKRALIQSNFTVLKLQDQQLESQEKQLVDQLKLLETTQTSE
jgi:hypothetical protein